MLPCDIHSGHARFIPDVYGGSAPADKEIVSAGEGNVFPSVPYPFGRKTGVLLVLAWSSISVTGHPPPTRLRTSRA